MLAGFLGIYILWQGRDRSLAWLLSGMFVIPLSFILLLSFWTPVSTFYFLPTVPILFMGAGFFWTGWPDWTGSCVPAGYFRRPSWPAS